MKKIFILVFVFVLAACGASKKEIAMHDEDFRGCERIVTSFRHLVYKCPAKFAWVWEKKILDADEMFKTVKDIDWTVANADTEHTLVEIVLRKSEICPERFYYRTTEKSADGKDSYTVVGCK